MLLGAALAVAACAADEAGGESGKEGEAEGAGEGEGEPYTGELLAPDPVGPMLTADRFVLFGTFFRARPDLSALPPVVVLAHEYGQTRRQWTEQAGSLIEDLRRRGLAVFTYDLRAHGESKSRQFRGEPGDYCDRTEQCKSGICSTKSCTAYAGEGQPVDPWQKPYNYQDLAVLGWDGLALDLAAVRATLELMQSYGWPLDATRLIVGGSDVGAGAVLRYLAGEDGGRARAGLLIAPLASGVDGLTPAALEELGRDIPARLPLLLLAAEGDRLATNAVAAIARGHAGSQVELVAEQTTHGLRLLAADAQALQAVFQWLLVNR